MAHAEAVCRASHGRLTPIRRRTLEALYAAQRPLGAYEVAEALAPGRRSVAPITAYRALDFLIEQGLAHKLASRNAYIPSCHSERDPDTRVFLICETCGRVDEATSPELSAEVDALVASAGFEPRARVSEIVGRCSRCRNSR
jgi:Fur family zinc uptake transcriptional regulator